MVRDTNGQKQAIVGDIPGLVCVKCVGRYCSGNRELQIPAGEKQVVRCSDSFIKYVLRYFFQICPSIQVLISDILSAGHLDNINWEFFVRTVKYFFGFLASHNRFSLVYKFNNIPISRFARPFCSQSMEGFSLVVVNFSSKQLFADFFFVLFPFPMRAPSSN